MHRIDHDDDAVGAGEDRGAPRARRRVRDQEREAPHRAPAAARARAVREGRQLRRAGRPGPDRRRVHRPHDAGPALVGRPAPGGRGEGRREGQGRDADARDDHDPELLPHVREARGHDRHRRDRGDRVPPDLQAGRVGHPDQQADCIRDDRHDLVFKTRREKYNAIVDESAAAARARLPGARRHGERRGVGDARRACSSARASRTTC